MTAAAERKLPAHCLQLLDAAAQLTASGDLARARQALAEARAQAGEHVDILRAEAAVLRAGGDPVSAANTLYRAVMQRPRDADLLLDFGLTLRQAGDAQHAYEALVQASEAAPDSAKAWFHLGEMFRDGAYPERALEALSRARSLDPRHQPTVLVLADVLRTLGRTHEAAAMYRDAIRIDPAFGEAWHGLTNLKTERLDDTELAALERLHAQAQLVDPSQRIHAGFALASALERAGRHADAFAALAEANRLKRSSVEWDATAFSRQVDDCIAAFERGVAAATDAALGREVVFIVSLPRAGSSLTEQILASHSSIEGAGELPDLGQVVHEESERRGQPFAAWADQATPEDWSRLGRRYLEHTQRWRQQRPIFVDKALSNWMLVGAIFSMLPGARVIDCRRDPLETCWSCYTQLFRRGTYFSYDFADLAAFWHDYDRLMRYWQQRYPGRIRVQSHEALLADPDGEIRGLLDHVGVPFEDACLNFHETRRQVRTVSAAQVREPLRRDTARTKPFGALLDPLRQALAAG